MAAPALSFSNSTARLGDPALREALLRYARRRVPAGEVEDLVQNTLTEALTSSSSPLDPAELYRWVHGIARHKIADSYRRRGRTLPLADREPSVRDPGPDAKELSQWIEHELPKTHDARATLHWLLRESDGESLDEIARDAALPAPRVRQRVSRLRRHFHSRWLALGAAGLALLLSFAWLLRSQRAQTPPPIVRETLPSAAPVIAPEPAPRALPAAPSSAQPAPVQLAPQKLAPQKLAPKAPPSKAKPTPQGFEPLSKKNAAPPQQKF